MKTTGLMNYGGKLEPEYRAAWARYYCRYAHEYEKEGIPIWGLTVQNEPEATQTWDSCLYSAEEERDFVRDYLGPALEQAGLSRLRVIIWDHNRDRMFERAKVVLFVVSGTVAAVVGAMMAPRFQYVEPLAAFNPMISFLVVIMALLGGAHRLWGPLVGVIPFYLLWDLTAKHFPNQSALALGIAFLLIVYFIPNGVVGLIKKTVGRAKGGAE